MAERLAEASSTATWGLRAIDSSLERG